MNKGCRIHIRINENFYELLNYACDFFCYQKTFFIKEMCVGNNLIVLKEKNIDDKILCRFEDVSKKICNLKNELKNDYCEIKKGEDISYYLDEECFEAAVNYSEDLLSDWTNLYDEFFDKGILEYDVQIKCFDKTFDVLNMDWRDLFLSKEKDIFIRISPDLYQLLNTTSVKEGYSLTTFITEKCLVFNYLEISGVLKSERFKSVGYSITNDIREILSTLKEIRIWTKKYLSCDLFDVNSSFKKLCDVHNELFEIWKTFEIVCGEIEKNLYFKYFKHRVLFDDIKDSLKNDKMYYKRLCEREVPID